MSVKTELLLRFSSKLIKRQMGRIQNAEEPEKLIANGKYINHHTHTHTSVNTGASEVCVHQIKFSLYSFTKEKSRCVTTS